MEKTVGLFLLLLTAAFFIPYIEDSQRLDGFSKLYSLDALIVDNPGELFQCGVVIALSNISVDNATVISPYCSCKGKGVVVDKESYFIREDYPLARYEGLVLAFRKPSPVFGIPIVSSSKESWVDKNRNGVIDEDEQKGPFGLIAYCGKDICIGDKYFFNNDMLSQKDNLLFLKRLVEMAKNKAAYKYGKDKVCIYDAHAKFAYISIAKGLVYILFLPPLLLVLLAYMYMRRKEEREEGFYSSLARRIKSASSYLKEKWRKQLEGEYG